MSGEGVASSPREQLLAHNARILDLQEAIRARRIRRRIIASFATFSLVGSLASFIGTVATWGRVDLVAFNQITIPLTVVAFLIFLQFALSEGPDDRYKKRTVRRLQLDLDLAEEARRLDAAQLGLPVYQRQYAYKDSVPRELERLRKESGFYRRIHNSFQSVIIIGSLGTTTVASLTETTSNLKWATVGISFLVGVSAGFTGYFKYRERSFYLQQTADAIEQNSTAFELGIYPYDDPDEGKNLHRLTREVELLRVEQRKRQQQLDQPHEGREEVV